MSGKRAQRQRRAPQRFGQFASPQAAEDLEAELLSEEEEEVPARKAGRCRRRHPSESEEEEEAPARRRAKKAKAARQEEEVDEEEDDELEEDGSESDSSSSGDEAGDDEAPAPRQRQQPSGVRGRSAAGALLWVPPPPAEPRSRSDVLSMLFACPALIDALLEADGLRTVSLVARDGASLAAALCATTADMAGLWHQMARRCDPRFKADASVDEALEVVRRAMHADAARRERCNKSTAQGEYRLTQKDLAGLEYTTRPNPVFWQAAPVKMYNKLDVLAVAHRRYGSAAGLQAAKAAAKERSDRAKATRTRHEAHRKQEMAAALQRAGLAPLTSYRYRKNSLIKSFLKSGNGTAAGVAAAIKAEEEQQQRIAQREKELHLRFNEEGCPDERHSAAARAWAAGTGHKSLEEVVAEAKAEAAERKARRDVEARRQERRERVRAALTAAGMPEYGPSLYANYGLSTSVPGMKAFLGSGEGSVQAVVAAAQELRDAAQAKSERKAQALQLFEAEGLAHILPCLPGYADFVDCGEGSADALLAAGLACRLREQSIHALLEAEGLTQQADLCAVRDWVYSGEGSEAAVLEAARQAGVAHARRAERRQQVTQLLAAEGIEYHSIFYRAGTALMAYVERGEGSEAAALAAAQDAHRPQRERDERQAALTARLAAEGVDFEAVRYSVDGLQAYVYRGVGSEDAAVAAALRHRQEVDDRQQRRERVAALLQAEGMALEAWEGRCYELHKYLQYAEGGAEEAVAAAKRARDGAAARAAAQAAAQAVADQAAAEAAIQSASAGP